MSSDSAASRLSAAENLYGTGRYADALNLLLPLALSDIGQSETYLLLVGACFARLRNARQAVATFEKLLAQSPDCFEALTWMAVLKKNRTEIHEAIRFAQRAIEIQPNDAASHGALGSCYYYQRQPGPAIAEFQKAIELSPDIAEHHHNLGLALLMDRRHGEAIVQFRQAIDLAPKIPHSYVALAGAYSLYGMAGDALDCLAAGLVANPDSPALHSAAASAFSAIKNDAAAERHHKRAIALAPDSKSAYAAWLLNQGRFSESDAIYEAMIQAGQDRASAYYGLMQSRKVTEHDGAFVAEIESLLGDRTIGVGGEMRVEYALGKAHEQLRHYETAMAHYDAANRHAYAIHLAGHPIGPEHFRREHDQILRCYEQIDCPLDAGNPSQKPIFIIGMVRSGTTLLDQVLSSHKSVSAAGELRFWMEESLKLASSAPTGEALRALGDRYLAYIELLGDDAERITDKMPLNFAHTGIIHRALPNARFLHIRRHPVDTCLSIYTTYFGQGSLFAYNRSNILAYYREYLRMMDYWRSVIPPDRLLVIDYEDLISQPEAIIPRIIEFCDLPWDDACLRHDQNPVAINTPSRWQARQPMYKTSMERWRHYEPWLGEFSELL